MFRHELGVLAQAVAGSFDMHDDGMVEQTIEQCRGHDGIAEHVAPFGKATVGGEDHGAAFVARADELENRLPPPGTTGR